MVTAYKFNGKEKDEETGMYYYGARYFIPELSIWLSVDPLSDKYPSLSSYSYCAGNPMKYVDPDGRDIDPTDETSKQATNKYIESFNNKISGEELFGVKRDENGVLSSTLRLTDKQFAKRAEKKGGLTGDDVTAAKDFYSLLKAKETVVLRTISVGESEEEFYSKGKSINGYSDGLPHFTPKLNMLMEAPNKSTNYATNESIENGFLRAMYKGVDWASPYGGINYDDKYDRPLYIFKTSNSTIDLKA